MTYPRDLIRACLAAALLFTFAGLLPPPVHAQSFKDQVGAVNVRPVTQTNPLNVPFITWGGDMATFYANGGLKTKPGSIFQRQGLNLNLTAGDDFTQQVRDYMSGKSPFLRGTVRMMGAASEVIASDPRTKGVMIMQLTWSAGDHCVARGNVRTVSDLRGKTVVLQQGGPHMGMLDDILKTAGLSYSDITVKWAKDLTATPNSPAEMFRKDPNIAACFVITPDMFGLCSGLHDRGTGAEGTVRDARVLVSTAELSKSIADVYICRKDFYDANPALVQKFVAGYLKAAEEVIDLKKKYEASGSADYMKLLQLTQNIYGKDVIPTLEDDAHGLLSDCKFVGHPGNVAFFTKQGNLHGFEAKQKAALDLAAELKLASFRAGFVPSPLNWNDPGFLKYLSKTEVVTKPRFESSEVQKELSGLTGSALDDKTIYSFTINFQPNQENFPAAQYGAEFNRVVELADQYGNAVIAIRGHADPTKTLKEMVQAGMETGILQQQGQKGNRRYLYQGRALDLKATGNMLKLIEGGAFAGGVKFRPAETMHAALNLSQGRAKEVQKSILDFAKNKGIDVDASQIQPVGVGIREPVVARPRTMDQAKQNMRVEFRLVRVKAEVSESDFDF